MRRGWGDVSKGLQKPGICRIIQQEIIQWEEETGETEVCSLPDLALLSPALAYALPPTLELVWEHMQEAQTVSATWLHSTAAWNALPTPKQHVFALPYLPS